MEQDLPNVERVEAFDVPESTPVQAGTTSPAHEGAYLAKAVGFGIVAAFLGCVLYAAVDIVVSSVMGMREHTGYLGIAIGLLIVKTMGPASALLIGRAMRLGSGRRGGLKYQVVAVVLTYLAITMAQVPILFWQFHQQGQNVTHMTGGLVWAMTQYGLTSPLIALQDLTSGTIGILFLFGALALAWWATSSRRGPRRG
jgi:hypothetical protein